MVPSERENFVVNLRCMLQDSSRKWCLGGDGQNALRCQCVFNALYLLSVMRYANHHASTMLITGKSKTKETEE